MLKKIFIMFITITLLVGICGSVNATELRTTLDVIQQASETKYLDNDQGYISKTIVDSNAEIGEVTIELKLSNTKKEKEETKKTEIFLVIDNSISMDYNSTETATRKSLIVNAATNLVNKISDNTSNVKVGVVRFASKWSGTESSTGKEYSQPNAANLMCSLTDSKETVVNSITEYKNMETEAGTNIYAGLKKAYQNFSEENNNKIIILLTDGVPTEYTESNYDYATDATVDNNTKSYIQTIGKEVTLISLMAGIANDSEDSDDLERVENIFGTETNPTSGYFYNISDADIESVVNNDIFANVMEKVQNPINTVKIVDYFPEDITEIFEFSYVGNASTGTASEGIDEEAKTISWDIGTLKGDEVATLKYKLKIKDMKNIDLLNKTIATNEKVVLTYKDTESKDYTVELTSSPKIQLSEVKEELTATVTYDPTTNTTGKVTATIKTNKKVNEVEGWTLSEDGMTLTKEYSINATEIVHLVDTDNMTKDVVVKISNIIKEEPKQPEQPPKDDTIATGKLPQTGVSATIIISLIAVIILIIIYKKYNTYKDIK